MGDDVEFKASVSDEGKVVLKRKSKIRSGTKSKNAGSVFELRVRKDLEEKGWFVDKWSNNIDLSSVGECFNGKIIPAKRIFRRFGVGMGVMTIGTGFPDFICFQNMRDGLCKIIGVEVKMNGVLSREEKLKCSWLLEHKVFSEILIASKIKEKNRVRVEYENFLGVERRMRK